MPDGDFAEIEHRYRTSPAHSVGLQPNVFERPATFVVAEDDRAGTAMAVGYHLGRAAVIRTDPALYDRLQPWSDNDVAIRPDQVRRRAGELDLTFVDGGDQHLIAPDDLRPAEAPDTAEFCLLVATDHGHWQRIDEFLAGCHPDDVDAAEFDPDELDPFLVALSDTTTGQLVALASARKWNVDARFDDIGVLTAEPYRGHGWGQAVVAGLCRRSLAADRHPLYRNNWDRSASKALALSLGFRLVAQLTAISAGRPDDP